MTTTTLHPTSLHNEYTIRTQHPHTSTSSTSTAPPSAAHKMTQRAQTITQCQHDATRTVTIHNIIAIHTSLCASSGKPANAPPHSIISPNNKSRWPCHCQRCGNSLFFWAHIQVHITTNTTILLTTLHLTYALLTSF